MTIEIRQATIADRDELVRFNEAMARETEGKALDRGQLARGVDAVLGDSSKGFYLVATNEGRVAGGLLITTEWSDWRNAYFWWIQSVFVEPAYRRKGVYTQLHRWVEETARSRRDVCGLRLYVDRDNARAQATYESLGMTRARYDFYELTLR
jgi:GNAT superfamily N-acetyltransferase